MEQRAFSQDGVDYLRFVRRDSLINLTKILLLSDLDREGNLRAFDELVEEAERTGNHPFIQLTELDEPPALELVGLLTLNLVETWLAEQISARDANELLLLIDMAWHPPETPSAASLDLSMVLMILAEMSALDLPDGEGDNLLLPGNSREIAAKVGGAFLELTEDLARRNLYAIAHSCAQSAIHFLVHAGHTETVARSIDWALRLVKRSGDEKLLSMELGRAAIDLARVARNEPARRGAAMDAFERLFRHQMIVGNVDPQLMSSAVAVLEGEEYLNILRPKAFLALPVEMRKSMPDEVLKNCEGLVPIWEGDLSKFPLQMRGAYDIQMEDERLALSPKLTSSVAETSWSTWKFRHSAMLRAIPHSVSLLREQYADDLLLMLSHEINHVIAISGTIGGAIQMLSWAHFEAELDLWASSQAEPNPDLQGFFDRQAPARLGAEPLDRVTLLPRVERSLEMERKIQVLERIWSPILEGLAVFGEVGADPTQEPSATSAVGEVIVNLVDHDVRAEQEANGGTPPEAMIRLWQSFDGRMAEAQNRCGRPRLRYYLRTAQDKYLVGYLAIRTIAAAWRQMLDEPLCGHAISRALVHAFRHNDTSMLPDPALPLEEFQRQAVDCQIAWLQLLSQASAEDIRLLLGAHENPAHEGRNFRWEGNRVVMGDPTTVDEREERIVDIFMKFCSSARRSLSGDGADPDRVPDADEACRLIMGTFAKHFDQAAARGGIMNPKAFRSFFYGRLVMPIGTFESGFWLIREGRGLVCLIRTRECDQQTGKPSYNLQMVPLPEAKFAALEAKLRTGPPARMTISRVAVLQCPAGERPSGSNYMVFQLEDWMHIKSIGFMFGAAEVPAAVERAISARLSPNDLFSVQEVFSGPEHPCARRSLEWLKSREWKVTVDGISTDLGPWAARAATLAEDILSTSTEDDTVSIRQALTEFIAGVVDGKVAREGFDDLTQEDPEILDSLIEKLFETAKEPVVDPDFEPVAAQVRLGGESIFKQGKFGWDVRTPAVSNKRQIPI